MCTVPLPPGGYPIAVNKYNISYINCQSYIIKRAFGLATSNHAVCCSAGMHSSARFFDWLSSHSMTRYHDLPMAYLRIAPQCLINRGFNLMQVSILWRGVVSVTLKQWQNKSYILVNFRTKKPDSVYLFLDCKWGEDQLNAVS